MKLRNKKTGEIGKPAFIGVDYEITILPEDKNKKARYYKTLAELNEEWEDYEQEPKEYWFINASGEIYSVDENDEDEEDTKLCKEIGNYFETKEEAEKAVEKLKTWKRLKDKGFRFEGWTIDDGLRISICTNFDSDGIYDDDKKEMKKDLDTCFGGGE